MQRAAAAAPRGLPRQRSPERRPFRCPRCGGGGFRSLSALRAHLERGCAGGSLLGPSRLLACRQDAELLPAAQPRGGTEGPRPLELEAERPASLLADYAPPDAAEPGFPGGEPKAALEAHVREKFSRMVEAVDQTIEKRIERLTQELARKTAELLEVRAAFVQLSQKKQEVQRRERALSRQVDVAVEMIAALKQRLSESEEELHRKEEEVVTFNHFLEEAAEKEVRGKARLQHFIENLLQRVDLAERQLEYYQNQQLVCCHKDVDEPVFAEISLHKKPRCLSRGSQHTSYNIPDTKPHSFQRGRILLKKVKDEKNGIQPVKYFYEPVDCPRELWRPQKKAELVCSARKQNAKSKMGKKSKPL